MSNPRYDYFNTSVDKEANQALVKAISGAVIEAVRPKEAIATPYVIGSLLDRAARGEVVRAGSRADFGMGAAGDLLAYVVVPMVTNLSTEVFKASGVAGIGGLSDLPDPLPTASTEEVARMAGLSGIRISRKEAMQVAAKINELFRMQLAQVVALAQAIPRGTATSPEHAPFPVSKPAEVVTQPRNNDSPCAPYDCARLRQIFVERFNTDDLRTLCFDLGVPKDEIILGKHNINVIELIGYFQRRDQLSELVAAAQKGREDIDWGYALI